MHYMLQPWPSYRRWVGWMNKCKWMNWREAPTWIWESNIEERSLISRQVFSKLIRHYRKKTHPLSTMHTSAAYYGSDKVLFCMVPTHTKSISEAKQLDSLDNKIWLSDVVFLDFFCVFCSFLGFQHGLNSYVLSSLIVFIDVFNVMHFVVL